MFLIRIALRYISLRKVNGFTVSTWLSIIGITLSVVCLIVINAIMKGFHNEMINSIRSTHNDISVIGLLKLPYDSPKKLKQEKINDIINLIQDNSFIKDIVIEHQGYALLLKKNNISRGVMLKCIDIEKKRMDFIDKIAVFDYKNDIVITNKLAEDHLLKIGDQVNIIKPTMKNSMIGLIPQVIQSRIGGIITTRNSVNDLIILSDIRNSDRLFYSQRDKDNDIVKFNIGITVKDISNIDKDITILKNQIRNNKKLGSIYQVNSSFMAHKDLLELIAIQRVGLLFIFGLLAFISAFNILSNLILLIKEKLKDIAIMKTYGMSNLKIMQIFLFTSIILSIIGIILGIIFSFMIISNIDIIQDIITYFNANGNLMLITDINAKIPVMIDMIDIVYISIFVILIAIFASIYPAYIATRANIVGILKNE